MGFRLFAVVGLVLAVCCGFIAYGQDQPAKKEGMQHEHMRHAQVDEALVKAVVSVLELATHARTTAST
jgi:hypothetical protein